MTTPRPRCNMHHNNAISDITQNWLSGLFQLSKVFGL